MIIFITGASGSGKTACIPYLQKVIPEFQIFDFDDIGVPENPDKKWRQESTEAWLQKYLNEDESAKYCICGQVVLGEILACPSAKQIPSLNVVLLDVSDIERINRLTKRNTYGANQDMLNWAAWLRMHHHNPQWHQNVIKDDSWDKLDFSIWDQAQSWEPHACVNVIDTTDLSLEQVAKQIAGFIQNG